MSIFSVEFIVQNVVIALIVSVAANILSSYIIKKRQGFVDVLSSEKIMLLGGILFFTGMIAGMGTGILINENSLDQRYSYVAQTGIGVFSIGLCMISLNILVNSLKHDSETLLKIFGLSGIVLGVIFLVNLPVVGKFSG